MMKQKTTYWELTALGVVSLVIGVFAGAVDTFFGKILLSLSAFRDSHFLPLILFLPIIGICFTYLFQKYATASCGTDSGLMVNSHHAWFRYR